MKQELTIKECDVVSLPSPTKAFDELYLAVREKENRLYSDRQVKQLPFIEPLHPHFAEWVERKNSAEKLIAYLAKPGKVIRILEIGCGNGWLANRLAKIPGSEVTAIDVNSLEVEQARRVFGSSANLRFLNADLADGLLNNEQFDVIIFAAAIQYFENPDAILRLALDHLKTGGSIHLIDSFFYHQKEVENARRRTEKYYADAGFPEMSQYYFHHPLDRIKRFNYKILYDPNSVTNRLIGRKHPFPWILIRH